MLFSGAESCQGLSRELLPVWRDHGVPFQGRDLLPAEHVPLLPFSLGRPGAESGAQEGGSRLRAMTDLEASRRVPGGWPGPSP